MKKRAKKKKVVRKTRGLLIDYKTVVDHFEPWAIKLQKDGKYVANFETMEQCSKYSSIWKDANGNRKTAMLAAGMIATEDWLGKRHQVHSLMRYQPNPERPFLIVSKEGVVLEGNHRLCAWILMGLKRPVFVLHQV